ncbi:hypothetical protein, partial [Thiolapillus sp.]
IPGKFGGAAASAIIGGTASTLSGGKFANGALSGAFGYLFNQEAHNYSECQTCDDPPLEDVMIIDLVIGGGIKTAKFGWRFVIDELFSTRGRTTVIGRVKDLQNLRKGEQSLLNRLPDRGSPKANWKQNSSVLRKEMARGKPIRDASPGDTSGQFLNAERNLLRNRGWTFDSETNYWNPPN